MRVLAAAVLAGGIRCGLAWGAEEAKSAPATGPNSPAKNGKVVGIVTDKTDKAILVKPEGKAESERYLLAPPNGTVGPSVQAAIKMLFVPNLVALKWARQDEDAVVTELTVIRPKLNPRISNVPMGTVFGTVVARERTDKSVYVDVKPGGGRGFTECYWPPFVIDPGTHKGGFDMKVIDAIGALNVGDKVKVDWYYDERKRAAKVQVVVHAPAPKTTEKEKE